MSFFKKYETVITVISNTILTVLLLIDIFMKA